MGTDMGVTHMEEDREEDRKEDAKPDVKPDSRLTYEGFSPDYLRIYYGMCLCWVWS